MIGGLAKLTSSCFSSECAHVKTSLSATALFDIPNLFELSCSNAAHLRAGLLENQQCGICILICIQSPLCESVFMCVFAFMVASENCLLFSHFYILCLSFPYTAFISLMECPLNALPAWFQLYYCLIQYSFF